MKIIKKGIRPEEQTLRSTCLHCQTIFEFSTKEGTRMDGGQREGTMYKIDCPTCGYQCYGYPKSAAQLLRESERPRQSKTSVNNPSFLEE